MIVGRCGLVPWSTAVAALALSQLAAGIAVASGEDASTHPVQLHYHHLRTESVVEEPREKEKDKDNDAQQNSQHDSGFVGMLVVSFLAIVLLGAWWWSAKDGSATMRAKQTLEEQEPLIRTLTNASSALAPLPSVRMPHNLSVPNAEPVLKDWCETWERLAQTGELDIYTCMGLRNGFGHFGPRTRRFLPNVIMLIFMQAVLPILLAKQQMQHFKWHALEEQDLTVRCIGFLLFGYSILNLYTGALDDCRTIFLEIALRHNVSWWFLVPTLFGEVMNSFTSFVLTNTLFVVFCAEGDVLELLIKALAINFVVTVDNEWTTEEMRMQAQADFKEFKVQLEVWDEEQASYKSRTILHLLIMAFCTFTRVFGTLFIGTVFAFVFLFQQQADLCRHLRPINSLMVCD